MRKEWHNIFKILKEKTNLSAKNTISSEAVFQQRKWDENFPEQTKAEGINYH